MPVICEGCGQRVPIPEGYRRNKIQCACGVICSVPEAARQEAGAPVPKRSAAPPSPSVEEEAERWLLDDSPASPPPSEAPPIFREPEPVAEPKPARSKPAVAEMRFPCRRCRRMIRRQGECPDCNGVPPQTTESGERVWWPSVDEPADKDEEEDSSPYGVEGADDVKCPQCCFMLPAGSVLCVRCGFHLKKRKKVVKSYQPIERVWETNAPLQKRLTLFIVCATIFVITGVVGIFDGGLEPGAIVFSFLSVTAMAAFLFGTFDRIHLIRDERGRVRLTKTWRFCFFARPPQRIDVHSYEGIVSGRHRDLSFWDYLIFFMLVISGIIPGLIWWYMAIYKVSFHVSLSRDHGFPSYILYSGWSETQMKEIAYTLRDAAGLPYDEG
jgi:hypothetical protein